MDTNPAPATSAGILELVQHALKEIDDVELDATLRRTIRIASLLGDSFNAIRLSMEITPSGGHPPANAEMTRRLMTDPTLWGAPGNDAETAVMQFLAERAIGDDLVSMHSVAEMRFFLGERFSRDEISGEQYKQDISSAIQMHQHLERARHHAFTLLCRWERQLTFSTIQEDSLAVVRRRVDALLGTSAQDVLEAFNITFRRLREASAETSTASAGELLSQAVSSCRRILKTVIDTVEPASTGRRVSETGHALTDDAYKNRLVEFLGRSVTSNSFRGALLDDGESLFKRFASVDAIASKGVHAQLASDEAEFCALHTYLLAGEILLINEPGTASAHVRAAHSPSATD